MSTYIFIILAYHLYAMFFCEGIKAVIHISSIAGRGGGGGIRIYIYTRPPSNKLINMINEHSIEGVFFKRMFCETAAIYISVQGCLVCAI